MASVGGIAGSPTDACQSHVGLDPRVKHSDGRSGAHGHVSEQGPATPGVAIVGKPQSSIAPEMMDAP